MKVYINNRDLLTWPKAMADLLAGQGHTPIFVDNASTYQPLLDWYDGDCPYGVIRLDQNIGHTAPWNIPAIDGVLRMEWHAVTDPDMGLDGLPADWAEVMMHAMNRAQLHKLGLSLLGGGVPSANPAWIEDNFKAYPDEEDPAHWGPIVRKVGNLDLHAKAVDTTFALYRPGTGYCVQGLRTGRPYVARHLPWHIVPELYDEPGTLQIPMTDELRHYYRNAHESSITAGRIRKYGLV